MGKGDVAAALDHPDDRPCRQLEIADQGFLETLGQGEAQDLALSALHQGKDIDILGMEAIEQLFEGRLPGRDHHIDPDPLKEGRITDIAHPGDDPFATELFHQERTEQIFFIVVGDADGHVAIADRLALEQFDIGAVPLEDQTFFQVVGQVDAAVAVVLDQLDANAGLFEFFREHETDAAAADDGRGLDLVHVLKHLCRQDIERRTGAHEHHLVIGLNGGGPIGNEQAVVAGDADDEHVLRKGTIHDPSVTDNGVLLDAILEHLGLAMGEILHIDGIGHGNNAEDILGEQLFRPDNGVDIVLALVSVLRERVEVAVQFHPPHKADGLGLGDLLGGPAGHDIGLVDQGTGDKKIGLGSIGTFQDLNIGAVARNETDIEIVEFVGQSVEIIDNGYIVFAVQLRGHHVADFGCTVDENIHKRIR